MSVTLEECCLLRTYHHLNNELLSNVLCTTNVSGGSSWQGGIVEEGWRECRADSEGGRKGGSEGVSRDANK